MRTQASVSPLTVWVGSEKYVFIPPGRDVVVGYGERCDISLDDFMRPGSRPQPQQPELVLRFAGTRWVAINRSSSGIFVDGARVSAVDIRDGQAITIGDPQRGPRLVFNFGASPGRAPGPPPGRPAGPPVRRPGPSPAVQLPPPPTLPVEPPPPPAEPSTEQIPAQPHRPVVHAPTERETQKIPISELPPPKPEEPK